MAKFGCIPKTSKRVMLILSGNITQANSGRKILADVTKIPLSIIILDLYLAAWNSDMYEAAAENGPLILQQITID